MAYETASASGVSDLLSKLRTFAIAQGWNVDFYGTRGTSFATSQALMLNKGGLYFGFFTEVQAGTAGDPGNYFGSVHYPGPYATVATDAVQQTSYSATRANNMPGPYEAYHFFSGTNTTGQSYIHVVVEAVSGSFRHLGIGVINKAGAITTGSYVYGCRWNWGSSYLNSISSYQAIPWDAVESYNNTSAWGTSLRADGDTVSPRYYRISQSAYSNPIAYSGIFTTYSASGLALSPSTLTGRSILLPIVIQGARPSGYFSNLGGPPDIRFVNIENLLPGAIVTIGSDNWKTFPIIRKSGAIGFENSGVWGYAYRIVT